MKVNLENAVHTALLLLPEKFNEFQLYSALTSLSYTGKIRTRLEVKVKWFPSPTENQGFGSPYFYTFR